MAIVIENYWLKLTLAQVHRFIMCLKAGLDYHLCCDKGSIAKLAKLVMCQAQAFVLLLAS